MSGAMRSLSVVLVLLASFAAAETPAAKLDVVIREFDVPTPKSRPHDPAVAPDGALWYTGQMTNHLGRLDLKTGAIREFPLKTEGSGPHGLVADQDGNIWYTGNFKAHVGKLDPRSGEVTEYFMPDREAAPDPHTPIFDQKGVLWFTVQRGNQVGRVDPRTGKVELKQAPTPRSRPYGIVVDSRGTPWVVLFGTNKLASIDPKTMELTEYTLPEGARPRRLDVAPDDSIYYTDYARGMLGRFDPRTKKVEEWRSPGGPQSQPYGIAITRDGMVWYSESGVEPNTLVRFDPKTKRFALAPIPSGGGVVRHMIATPDGRLYLACSGVNKVAVVEPRK